MIKIYERDKLLPSCSWGKFFSYDLVNTNTHCIRYTHARAHRHAHTLFLHLSHTHLHLHTHVTHTHAHDQLNFHAYSTQSRTHTYTHTHISTRTLSLTHTHKECHIYTCQYDYHEYTSCSERPPRKCDRNRFGRYVWNRSNTSKQKIVGSWIRPKVHDSLDLHLYTHRIKTMRLPLQSPAWRVSLVDSKL